MRLPRLTPERKRRIGEFGRSTNPYQHEDAMDRLLGRDTPTIAKAVGLARRTVQQWRDRYDSDHRGPGEVLALAIERALEIGREPDDALAPVDALLAAFGFARVPAEISVDADAQAQTTATCAATMRAACTALESALAAVADGHVTPQELAEFERLEQEAVRLLKLLSRELGARAESGRFAQK